MRIYALNDNEMEIKRDLYLQKLVASRHNSLIKVVTGMRRCGKSYLLFNLFVRFLKENGVDDGHIIQVDLEDRRNKDLRHPDALLAYIDSRMMDKGMYYILLDEVQHVQEFEDVLNSYLKVENADVYVTGSNSKFLSKDVVTEFRGRGDEIRVHPLCFREFISAWPGDARDRALVEYMTYGGLPQLFSLPAADKKEDYLKRQFEGTYLKDIKERHRIKNDADLEELIDVLASTVGSLTNPTNLLNTFKSVKNSNLALGTVKNYLDILQDAFLLEKAVRYDVKGRKYIGSPMKFYFEDLGLRNARLNFRQMDEGHLMENLLYNELRVRGFSVDVGQVIYNYKDMQGKSMRKALEVDFVCNRGFKRCYIQSAFEMPSKEKMEQELKSLSRINDSFRKLVIVGGLSPTYQNEDGIIIMNIFDFLLDENCLDI